MNKKTALAFSFGKESCRLLKEHKKHKPTLVFFKFRGCDVVEDSVRWIAERHNLEYLFINGRINAFTHSLVWNNVDDYVKHKNCMLRSLKRRGFKKLIFGSTKRDFIRHCTISEVGTLPESPPDGTYGGIEVVFPAWDWMPRNDKE